MTISIIPKKTELELKAAIHIADFSGDTDEVARLRAELDAQTAITNDEK